MGIFSMPKKKKEKKESFSLDKDSSRPFDEKIEDEGEPFLEKGRSP